MEECCFIPATLLKVVLLHGCFSRLLNFNLNCLLNGTKSRKASHDHEELLQFWPGFAPKQLK